MNVISQKNLKYILFLVAIIVFLFFCSVGLVLLIKKANNDKLSVVEANDVVFTAEVSGMSLTKTYSIQDCVYYKTTEYSHSTNSYSDTKKR